MSNKASLRKDKPNSQENSSALEQAQLLDLTPDQQQKHSRRPDPLAKPTWQQWCGEYDEYRRLLEDRNLRGKPNAFLIWHWLHNCKDRNRQTGGPRAQAWYIGRKFKMSRDTVYAMTALLVAGGYLKERLCQGCVKIFDILKGSTSLSQDNPQREFPFLLPAGCPPKPTPGQPGCPPKPTPGVRPYVPGCPPKPTPGVRQEGQPISDSTVSTPVRGVTAATPTFRRKLWEIDKDLDRTNALIREIRDKTVAASAADSLRLTALREQRQQLLDERAGVNTTEVRKVQERLREESHALQKAKIDSAPDAPGPMPGTPEYERFVQFLGRETGFKMEDDPE